MNPAADIVIPDETSSQETKRRAVYLPMIDKLAIYMDGPLQNQLDQALAPYRTLALKGGLTPTHFQAMKTTFQTFKATLLQAAELDLEAWKNVCRSKMFLSQVLFLDNNVKEGICNLASFAETGPVGQLTHYIQERAADHNAPLDKATANFYAALFYSQALMDLLFVRTDGVVHHKPGGVEKTSEAEYAASTLYLELSNSKLITACDAERDLCFELTTGWSEGIDLTIWNQLNAWYYGREHIFSKFYDDMLEAMLPQFAWSKARAAQTIVNACASEGPVHIVEIGAGSGAWAADFYNALAPADRDRFTYTGIEPGQAMIAAFHQIVSTRTGEAAPQSWRVHGGVALEDVAANPGKYLRDDAHNLIVFSFSAHHCFGPSLDAFLTNAAIAESVDLIYILEGVAQTGDYKIYHMWTDVESPEDFRNVCKSGDWQAETLWHEPMIPLANHAVTRAWSHLRRLSPPS